MKLRFPSYDDLTYVRVGHGQECVLIMIEDPDYGLRASAVLNSDEAKALGKRLIQQAKASQKVE